MHFTIPWYPEGKALKSAAARSPARTSTGNPAGMHESSGGDGSSKAVLERTHKSSTKLPYAARRLKRDRDRRPSSSASSCSMVLPKARSLTVRPSPKPKTLMPKRQKEPISSIPRCGVAVVTKFTGITPDLEPTFNLQTSKCPPGIYPSKRMAHEGQKAARW